MKHVFVIYGKANCANCDNIKEICRAKKKEFIYYELDTDFKTEDYEFFWKSVDKKNRQYPIIEYRGFLISYRLFMDAYLKEFLDGGIEEVH